MLREKAAHIWAGYEREQARILVRAAVKYEPDWGVVTRRVTKPTSLQAHSTFGRINLFRAIAGQLFEKLEIEGPRYRHGARIYSLTIAESKGRLVLDEETDGESSRELIAQLGEDYRKALKGLNYIGAIDAAIYVSSYRATGHQTFINYHLHAIVWGISGRALEARCSKMREGLHSVIRGANPVMKSLVKRGDIRQLVWYMTKSPRYQYQLYRKTNGYLKQYHSRLRPKNALRVFEQLKDVQLSDLVIAGGEGIEVKRLAFGELRKFARHSRPPTNLGSKRRN